MEKREKNSKLDVSIESISIWKKRKKKKRKKSKVKSSINFKNIFNDKKFDSGAVYTGNKNNLVHSFINFPFSIFILFQIFGFKTVVVLGL